MKSCLYAGRVRHRRFAPTENSFEYGLFMAYLDLAELDDVFRGRWLWSTRRAALARFRRDDHLGPADVPLDRAVRDLVAQETGHRPDGPIRLLTHLRYFGYVFNPVSFFYCYDADDTRVECVVAEVSNTPWNERHYYVLPRADARTVGEAHNFELTKAFHVSPFLPMDMDYAWRFVEPGERLLVHMANTREGAKQFDATLTLDREPVTGRTLAGVLVRFPLMTLKVIALIHWQALRLWWKRTPFYPHPDKRPDVAGTVQKS